MPESVSGQAYGAPKAAGVSEPASFRDPRTFVPHAYAEHIAGGDPRPAIRLGTAGAI
jgi:hypothetical protein